MDAVTVLRGIATLLVNPALGGGGIGSLRGAALLGQLATLVEGGIETRKELEAFAEDIQKLVDANGNPSRGQWEAMEARDQAARAALEANKVALEGSDPPKTTGNVQAQGGTQNAPNPGDPTT